MKADIKPGYDRVTAVLYFLTGLDKIPTEIVKNAQDRGTHVHENIATLEKGLGIRPLDDEKPYLESYKLWADGKTFLKKPDRWYDETLLITGECDAIYEEEGEMVLVDYKCTAKESPTWPLQLSAYRHLASKYGYTFKRVEIIKLCKKGKYPSIYTYSDNLDLFKKCLEIYRSFFKRINNDENLEYL